MKLAEYLMPKDLLKPGDVQRIVTLKRTTTSRHSFGVLKEVTRRLVQGEVETLTYEKGLPLGQLKGRIEEYDIFAAGKTRVFALEGFYNRWVKDLEPAPDTYIVAETDNGDLEQFDQKADKRTFVKLMVAVLGLRRGGLSAKDLVSLPLPQTLESTEALLRLAKASGWDRARIAEELDSFLTVKLLDDIKAGRYDNVYEAMGRTSPQSIVNRLLWQITELSMVKAYREMNAKDETVAKELGLYKPTGTKWEAVMKAADSLSDADLLTLVNRVIKLDRLFLVKPVIAADLFILGSGISVR